MKKYILWLGLALSSGVFSSCEKFLDQNTDPNNPSTATPNFLLPGIISQGAQTQMFTSLVTPYITQYLVRRSPVGSTDQFNFTNANSTNIFNYTYYYSAGNITPMIAAARAEGSPYYVGAGKIMMALVLSHATDMLGDIPYTEAFLGAENYTPKYDSQEQIYATVNQLLDEGVVELSKPAAENFRPLYVTVPSPSGDILYQGSVQKWIKLAYSLKARQLNHLSKKASFRPADVLALVDKGFTSSQDDAQLNFQVAVAPLTNTTNIFGTTRNNFSTTTFASNFIKFLNGTTYANVVDPRLPVMATALSTTGTDPGVTAPASVPATSATGGYTDFYSSWYARDLGYFEVITYHELKFIEAEAAYKAGQLDRAFTACREGIRAHMAKIGVGGSNSQPAVTFPVINQGQIDAYLASPALPQTPAQLTLNFIMQQKYIAMFLNPESWSDMRRYDFSTAYYPNLVFPVGVNADFRPVAGQPLKWPRRLLPGGTEVLYNPQEVARLLSSVGAASNNDYVTKPMWWDQP